jgi:hypothetical protein
MVRGLKKRRSLKLRYFLYTAEADIVCVDAVLTAVSSFQPLTLVTSKSKI